MIFGRGYDYKELGPLKVLLLALCSGLLLSLVLSVSGLKLGSSGFGFVGSLQGSYLDLDNLPV